MSGIPTRDFRSYASQNTTLSELIDIDTAILIMSFVPMALLVLGAAAIAAVNDRLHQRGNR